MSSNKHESVYPNDYDDGHAPEYGISKYEYYFGITLQGIISNPNFNRNYEDAVKDAKLVSELALEELLK